MAGRKSLYNEAIVKEIETSLSLGLTDKDAALASGISVSTFTKWQARYSDFSDRVTRAKAKRVQTWLLLLRQNAMNGDTRAIAELLDRCAPDYRKSSTLNVNVVLRDLAKKAAEAEGLDPDEVLAEAERWLAGTPS